jgi:Flp pilus assembly pilin Flp
MDGRRPGKERRMKRLFVRLIRETEGQDLVEYALLAATIALGVTAAMQLVRGALRNQFNAISTAVGS